MILRLKQRLEDLTDQLDNGIYEAPKGKRKTRGTPKEPLKPKIDTQNQYQLLIFDSDSDSPTPQPKKQKKSSSPKDGRVSDPYATDDENRSTETNHQTTAKLTTTKPTTTKPTTTKSAKKDKPLDSPDFILDNLVAPKFERAMKELGVNYDAGMGNNT